MSPVALLSSLAQGARPPSCPPLSVLPVVPLLAVLLKPPPAASQKACGATGRVTVRGGHPRGCLERLMRRENPCSCGQRQRPRSCGLSGPLHAPPEGAAGMASSAVTCPLPFALCWHCCTPVTAWPRWWGCPCGQGAVPNPTGTAAGPRSKATTFCTGGRAPGPTSHRQTATPSAGQPSLPPGPSLRGLWLPQTWRPESRHSPLPWSLSLIPAPPCGQHRPP